MKKIPEFTGNTQGRIANSDGDANREEPEIFRNGGEYPCLCKRGLVHIAKQDYLQDRWGTGLRAIPRYNPSQARAAKSGH